MDPTEKCTCASDKSEPSQESDSSASESPPLKEKKNKISLTSLGLNLRRGRSLQLKTKRSSKKGTTPTICTSPPGPSTSSSSAPLPSIKKSPKWGLRFNCAKKEPKSSVVDEPQSCCKCTCYRRTDEHQLGAGDAFDNAEPVASAVVASREDVEDVAPRPATPEPEILAEADSGDDVRPHEPNEQQNHDNIANGIYGNGGPAIIFNAPFFDIQWMRSLHEDCDEAARRQRAREIEQGVEAPANFRAIRRVQLLCPDMESDGGHAPRRLQLVCPSDLSVDSLRALFQNHVTVRSCPLDTITGCHTQVDFIHCLVPDLLDITNCSFYWGKMDRYEAERLLDGKPEGTFLLRDSAQEEFLFSVSFRKYGRSLHARIEQWNHKFSFDSHDPGVYTSDTVCGLIEHYKDPSSCMFFEPMLTWPLHRNTTFSLQHLCRSTITSRLTYDNVNQLELPKTLKSYLKEYHYRQKVRVERFDDDIQWLDLRNVPP